jgi:hypothetical protein
LAETDMPKQNKVHFSQSSQSIYHRFDRVQTLQPNQKFQISFRRFEEFILFQKNGLIVILSLKARNLNTSHELFKNFKKPARARSASASLKVTLYEVTVIIIDINIHE